VNDEMMADVVSMEDDEMVDVVSTGDVVVAVLRRRSQQ
jgi:hypothetical protein